MRIIIEDDYEYPIVYSNLDYETIKSFDKILYQIANNPTNNVERDWCYSTEHGCLNDYCVKEKK